jgi:hypothetical protein
MKKTVVVLTSIFTLLLSACSAILTPTPGTGPTVDTVGTSDALFKTAVAQTLTAQPTLPVVSVSDTATLPVIVESPTTLPTDTQIVLPAQTSTSVVPTATGGPTATGLPIGTSTATLTSNQLTASPTLGIRTYGTLPPEVPFATVTLVNKAKREAYISLQVTMPDGKFSILEYPVEGTIKIKSPIGQYLYVAWVGGNKMVGNFRLHENEDAVITLYKDRVTIK